MDLTRALQQSGALGRGSRVRTSDRFDFAGGLNLSDPPMSVAGGQLLGCKNYEPGIRGGYTRVEGNERFDGRESPTNGEFIALYLTGALSATPTLGEAVSDDTTGAGGELAYYDEDNFILIVVDTFDGGGGGFTATNGITCATSGATGTLSAVYESDAADDTTRETLIAEKTEYLRTLIEPVGGAACSGPVRGVAVYRDDVFAFRDNAAGTAGTMWMATSSGWTQIALGHKLYFDAGTAEIAEGDVVAGGGGSCTANRVVVLDGMWDTGDASGYIVTNAITGTFAHPAALTVGGSPVATSVSDAAQTLPTGGTYEYRVHNFKGADNDTRLYVVNGAGNAMEYGLGPLSVPVVVLIETGMVDDRPTHLFVHNDHLCLCYYGGSVQNSGYQTPLNFHPILGADERSVGADVVNVIEEIGNVSIISTRQQTYALYGDVVENFALKLLSSETGSIPRSMAKLGHTIYLDDRGFTTLKAATQYGNFAANSISDKILTLVQSTLAGFRPVGAFISRRKNLYRIAFNDGFVLALGARPGGKLTGWMACQFPQLPTCFASSEVEQQVGATGIFAERIFMGAQDGYVYELDVGRSFDGENIEAFLRFSYHHSGNPEVFKRYRRLQVDLDVNGPTTILGTVDYNYGHRSGQAGEELEYNGGGGFWDIASWDEFKWDGSAFDQVVLKLEGSGYNIGLFFYSNSATDVAHTLYGASMQESVRRINRGRQEG